MKKVFCGFLLFSLTLTLFGQETENSLGFSFLVRAGSSLGITGYNVSERGYEGETLDVTEIEYLPGFMLNSLQVGIGSYLSPQSYLAFSPGIWFDETFSRFAFTPGALFFQYALLSSQRSPLFNLQGGIFIEQPISLFGVFVNPSLGFQFKDGRGSSWFLDCGYLLTYWGQEGDMIDDTGKTWINNDEDLRHAVSLSTGLIF